MAIFTFTLDSEATGCVRELSQCAKRVSSVCVFPTASHNCVVHICLLVELWFSTEYTFEFDNLNTFSSIITRGIFSVSSINICSGEKWKFDTHTCGIDFLRSLSANNTFCRRDLRRAFPAQRCQCARQQYHHHTYISPLRATCVQAQQVNQQTYMGLLTFQWPITRPFF